MNKQGKPAKNQAVFLLKSQKSSKNQVPHLITYFSQLVVLKYPRTIIILDESTPKRKTIFINVFFPTLELFTFGKKG